jgi:hypothetical protein
MCIIRTDPTYFKLLLTKNDHGNCVKKKGERRNRGGSREITIQQKRTMSLLIPLSPVIMMLHHPRVAQTKKERSENRNGKQEKDVL